MKLKRVIEIHKYAPELNTIHVFRGSELVASVRTPGVTCFRQWREKFRPMRAFRHATIRTVYDKPEHRWLNQTHSGRVDDYQSVKGALAALKAKMLPGEGSVVVQTRMVGL